MGQVLCCQPRNEYSSKDSTFKTELPPVSTIDYEEEYTSDEDELSSEEESRAD